MSITIGDVWSSHGFLNNKYPSPFDSKGRRWRSVEEFVSVNGDGREVLLEGVTLKFKSNPHLLNMLADTDDTPIVGEEQLVSVLTEVRSLLSSRGGSDTTAFKRMMVSLTKITNDQGLTTASLGGRKVNIQDLEEGDYTIELSGGGKEGTLEIHLSSSITDSKVKSIVSPYKKEGLRSLYILVGSLSRGSVARSLTQLSLFHQIKYYSPSELLVDFQAHILSPRIVRVADNDPIHSSPIGSLSEISRDDPLIKQLGFSTIRKNKRTILEVYDFNPHYRVVV